jgi:hypothetical protein
MFNFALKLDILSTINVRTAANDVLKLLLKGEVVAYSKLLSIDTVENIIQTNRSGDHAFQSLISA